jgi:hypothetical protein
MAYNEALASRIAAIVAGWAKVTHKKMFGGIGYLMNGNLFCGIYKNYLILRLGPKAIEGALEKPWVRPFDITGRAMKGWVMVEESGFRGEKLALWLEEARTFTQTLPPQ